MAKLPLTGSLLVITPADPTAGLALPPYSARGVKCDFEQVPGNDPVMACSGAQIDMSHSQFDKLKVTLTCKDGTTPLMNKAWKGQIVTIDCPSERGFATVGGVQDRPAVPDAYGTGISTIVRGANTFYRPRLVCMIDAVTHGFDEYPADYIWQIVATETQVPTV